MDLIVVGSRRFRYADHLMDVVSVVRSKAGMSLHVELGTSTRSRTAVCGTGFRFVADGSDGGGWRRPEHFRREPQHRPPVCRLLPR